MRRAPGEIGAQLALGGDMALADAGALHDPLIRGVDAPRQLVVREDALGEIGPATDDLGAKLHVDQLRVPPIAAFLARSGLAESGWP